jgi:hypothetical protein
MALEAAIRRDPILTERQSALVNGALHSNASAKVRHAKFSASVLVAL